MNDSTSASRSHTSRNATDWTRPAERPFLTFFHKSGDRLYPTSRSSTRRAFWAFTFESSISSGCWTASFIACGVISLNMIRRIGTSHFELIEFRRCQAMASPSRSLSLASRTSLDFFASDCSSLSSFARPRTVMYSGVNPSSTFIAMRDFGKSMRWPMDALTLKPFPRYFSMVFAFAGDSTITSVCLVAFFFAAAVLVAILSTPQRSRRLSSGRLV